MSQPIKDIWVGGNIGLVAVSRQELGQQAVELQRVFKIAKMAHVVHQVIFRAIDGFGNFARQVGRRQRVEFAADHLGRHYELRQYMFAVEFRRRFNGLYIGVHVEPRHRRDRPGFRVLRRVRPGQIADDFRCEIGWREPALN